MMAWWLAMAVWSLAGLIGLGRSARAQAISAWGLVLGCGWGLWPALQALGGVAWTDSQAWSVPDGVLALGLDPLSAFFALPLLVVAALAAVAGQDDRRAASQGRHWFWMNAVVLSMAVVLTARHALLFLVAWEVMTVTSFFLVITEQERASVRQAGWTYLVAAHAGLALLLGFFLYLGQTAGSYDFNQLTAPGQALRGAGLLFFLALAGFGIKVGIVPLHVWLPEAHPAAPSHVSALLSGVMLKLGLYGLLRVLTFLGPLQATWGYTLLGVGVVSVLWGAAAALAQKDLKRLLAYSSVENMGLITLGLGLGCLGAVQGQLAVAVLGFGGALLHIWNHALFKSVLFLGAGVAVHATGERQMDRLGGLWQVMPWTGSAFLVGAMAITALPPLNGLVSEALLYAAGFLGGVQASAALAWPFLLAAMVFSVGGALAVAIFAKAFGTVFLGTARVPWPEPLHEAPVRTRVAMAVLSSACLLAGLAGPWLLGALAPVLPAWLGGSVAEMRAWLAPYQRLLLGVGGTGVGAVLLAGGLWFWRSRVLASRPARPGVTWDCGYAAPTARMQYTGSSLVEPLRAGWSVVVPAKRSLYEPSGWFPRLAGLSTEVPDTFKSRVFAPLLKRVAQGLAWMRWLQHGRIQLYVLYMAVALFLLLIWKLR